MTKGSKKFLVGALSLFAVIGSIHTYNVYAAESTSLLDALGGTTTSWTSSITTSGPTQNSITIEFPVFASNGESITSYAVSYVKGKSIATADFSEINKATFASDKVKIENDKASIVLEGLLANTTYNFVVMPVNKEGTELTPSDEFSFTTTNAAATTNGTTDNTTDTTTTDGTVFGAADTSAANFTYTISWSTVTVLWKSIPGTSKFNFSSKEATEANYSNIGAEQVSKEKYVFVLGKIGLYSVKIVPVDANGATVWAEKVLSVKIDTVSETPGKGTPATGVGLNLILMSTFLLMLIYVVYRFRTTK